MKLSKNKIIKLLQKKNQSYKKTNLAKRKTKARNNKSKNNARKNKNLKRNKTLKGGVKLDPTKIAEKSSEEQVAKSKQEFAQAAESAEELEAFKDQTQSKHTWSNPFFGEAKPRHSEILTQIDFISKRNELMKNPVVEQQLTKEILDDTSNTFNSQWRHIVSDSQNINFNSIIANGIGVDVDGAITTQINKTENKINETVNKLNEVNKALKNPSSDDNKTLIMSLGENAENYEPIVNTIKDSLDLLQKINVLYSDILELQNDIICLGGTPPTSTIQGQSKTSTQASQFESAEEKSMTQCRAELDQWKLKQEKIHKDEYQALMKNSLSAIYSIDCSDPEIAEPNCLNYNLNDIKVGQQISKNKQLIISAYEKIRKEKEEVTLPMPSQFSSTPESDPRTETLRPKPSSPLPEGEEILEPEPSRVPVSSKPVPVPVESIELAPQGEESKPAIMETSFIEPQVVEETARPVEEPVRPVEEPIEETARPVVEEPVVEETARPVSEEEVVEEPVRPLVEEPVRPVEEPVEEETREPTIEEVEIVPPMERVQAQQVQDEPEEGYVAVEHEDLPSQRQQMQIQPPREEQEPRIEEVEIIPSEQREEPSEEEGYVAIEREDLPSQRQQTESMREPTIEEVEILPGQAAVPTAASATTVPSALGTTAYAKRSHLFRPWEEYGEETEASETAIPQTSVVELDDGSKEILIKIVVPPKSQTSINAPGGDDVEETLLGLERDISKTPLEKMPQITVNIPRTKGSAPVRTGSSAPVRTGSLAPVRPERSETPEEISDEELQRRLAALRDEPQAGRVQAQPIEELETQTQGQVEQSQEPEVIEELVRIDPALLQNIEDALARNPTYEEMLEQESQNIPLIGREPIRMAPFTRPFGPSPFDNPFPTPPSSLGSRTSLFGDDD